MTKTPDTTAYELIGGHVRIFERDGNWHANFQHEGRQVRRSLKTTSKKEARRKAIQIEAKLANNEFAIQTRAPSVAHVIEKYRDYLQTEGRSPKTMAKYEYAFKLFLDLAERRKVRSILGVNQAFVDAFRAERRKAIKTGTEKTTRKAALKTVHSDTVLLRQVVNFAVRRGMIATDPLRGMKLSRPKPTPQPFWSRAEMDQIIATAGAVQRPVFIMLAETGMRIGEVQHLTWDDVDFANGVLHIQAKEGWKPKTGDARVVPMSPAVKMMLADQPRCAAWVFTAKASNKHPAGDHQVSERRLLQHLQRVLKKLGLRGKLHTFRHSFISHALTQNTAEALVRRWVGHVDAEVMKRYTHIADDVSKAAMARLAAASASSLSGKEVSHEDADVASRSARFQHDRQSA
jgi:integrase